MTYEYFEDLAHLICQPVKFRENCQLKKVKFVFKSRIHGTVSQSNLRHLHFKEAWAPFKNTVDLRHCQKNVKTHE